MLKNFDWARMSNYLAFSVIGLGFLALYLGWNGAANRNCVDCQIPYLISGGMTGLGLIATGIAVLVVQNGRRNRVEIEQKLDVIAEALEGSSGNPGRAKTAARATRGGDVVAGVTSYHRPGCRLVEGRGEAERMSVGDAKAAGLTACRVCSP
ncbi:MAG: hypothetical protein ACRDKJ_07965 [Actinomycetota bacterium]